MLACLVLLIGLPAHGRSLLPRSLAACMSVVFMHVASMNDCARSVADVCLTRPGSGGNARRSACRGGVSPGKSPRNDIGAALW